MWKKAACKDQTALCFKWYSAGQTHGNRFWYNSRFDTNRSSRKILPAHQFFDVLKGKLSIVVVELEQNFTVHVGMGV